RGTRARVRLRLSPSLLCKGGDGGARGNSSRETPPAHSGRLFHRRASKWKSLTVFQAAGNVSTTFHYLDTLRRRQSRYQRADRTPQNECQYATGSVVSHEARSFRGDFEHAAWLRRHTAAASPSFLVLGIPCPAPESIPYPRHRNHCAIP